MAFLANFTGLANGRAAPLRGIVQWGGSIHRHDVYLSLKPMRLLRFGGQPMRMLRSSLEGRQWGMRHDAVCPSCLG
jgi:hypothetical protein